jgi:hypothetical protein
LRENLSNIGTVLGAATIRAIGIALLTVYAFWDIFRSHPGNRLVRCGIITLSLFLVMGVLALKVPSFPVENLGPLLFLLCLLSMFFLIQRAYLAVQNRMKTNRSKPD